jgi:hypothetical protein
MGVFFEGLAGASTQTGDTGRSPEPRYIGAKEWISLPFTGKPGDSVRGAHHDRRNGLNG